MKQQWLSVRNVLLSAGLICIFGIGGCKYIRGSDSDDALLQSPANVVLHNGEPGPDVVSIPESSQRLMSASKWLEARKSRYAKLLANGACDVLIVPSQVEGGGFDRPIRDILTDDLAAAVESTGQCVVDPGLVDIALGEGQRHRDLNEVASLARSMHVGKVIVLYAGHYQTGLMRVTLQLYRSSPETGALERRVARSFYGLPFDDRHPPFLAFHERLSAMLSALEIDVVSSPATTVSDPVSEAIPTNIQSFLGPGSATGRTPIDAASDLAFLGMLAPATEWRATERLFAKAWVALDRAGGRDPVAQRLRATIMVQLRQRPYALSLIESDSSAEAQGIKAILNGNLPEAKQMFAQVQSAREQLFLGLAVNDLEETYFRDPRLTQQRLLELMASSQFKAFLPMRLGDYSLWSRNLTKGIVELLPKTATSGDLVPNLSTSDSVDVLSSKSDVEVAPIQELHRLVAERSQLWCCTFSTAKATGADLLDLFDSRLENTLTRQVYFYVAPQAQFGHALALLESYNDLLGGSPAGERLRAIIYHELLGQGQLDRQKDMPEKMIKAATLAALLDQAQSPETFDMLGLLSDASAGDVVANLDPLTEDYPIRSYWRSEQDRLSIEERLSFSTSDSTNLRQLYALSPSSISEPLQATLKDRFHGEPEASAARMELVQSNENAVEIIERDIKTDPENGELYQGLAKAQFRGDHFSEVERAILAYPPFQESHPNDLVKLSGYAATWGHKILWQGGFDAAKPLLKKAADYKSGAASGGYSAARLALLDHAYADAAMNFSWVGDQYSDLTANREFLCLLFAADDSRAGWTFFDDVTHRFSTSAFWSAAMVGHRRAKLSEQQLQNWYLQRQKKLNPGQSNNVLRSFAFWESVIDRKPDRRFVEQMRSLGGRQDVERRPDHKIYYLVPDQWQSSVAGPSLFRAQPHSINEVSGNLPDRYVLAAAAMTEFYQGRFDIAVDRFDQLSSYYSIESGDFSRLLPYFAYAAAKTGDTLGLEAYLWNPAENASLYDIHLARAVFAGLAGRQDDASGELDWAFHHWADSHADHFPLSAYEYLQACYLMYDATGVDAYRLSALKLARIVRALEPAFAYGHALVAALSDSANERDDALVMALFLDPDSRWASLAPAEAQMAAKAQLKRISNPFRAGKNAEAWQSLEAELDIRS